MLEYRREMYSSVEEKFLIDGQKYSVYVKGQEEINRLIQYLKYDFIKHESEKGPFGEYILSDEFVVSCYLKLSLVATYPSDRMLGFLSDFKSQKEKALPLFVFLDKDPGNNHPEYFI